MKGFTHFGSGIAAASFVPGIVEMSAEGSFVMLLAGLGALLPDTLDFKLTRFLTRPDVEIDPCLHGLDPQPMAEQVAAAIERAHRERRRVKVQLDTVRVRADAWQQYEVCFSTDQKQVIVRIGPRVTLAQVPYAEHEQVQRLGRAAISCPVHSEYGPCISVDILTGPMIACYPQGDGVMVEFLPWHRRWSHSLPVAALAGGTIALLVGPEYGMAFAVGAVIHILQDQLGHLGSSLFYPFIARRIAGLGWFHSGDVLPNLLTVWTSLVLLLYNLDRFAERPILDAFWFLGLGLALPWTATLGWLWQRRRRREILGPEEGGGAMAEIVSEKEQGLD